MRTNHRKHKMTKKTIRTRKQMLQHLFFVVTVMFAGFIVVIVNLVHYQLQDTSVYQKNVLSQQHYNSAAINYRRGDILDSKGSYLATSTKIYNLILEPKNIIESKKYKYSKTKETYEKITIDALYKYFSFQNGELEQLLKDKPNSYYAIVKKDLSYDEVSGFMEFLKSDEGKCVIGVSLEENFERVYPNKTAACQLIGYTVSGNVGTWGIEQQYNDQLNGVAGRKYSYITEDGTIETQKQDAEDGNTIVSTIDLNIQNIVDKQVSQFMKSVGAKNVSVLVMNPNNADVLAMSNSKKFDLNNPYDETALKQLYTDEEISQMTEKQKLDGFNEIWRNYIISNAYEPGSTFKPFTVGMALEEGVTYDGEQFYCPGVLHVEDRDIKCHGSHGMVTLEQAVAQSCNVTMMQLGSRLGRDTFTKYQSIFGFGQFTGIDLPGEASAENLIYHADSMLPTDLAVSTFGQGMNCTMIQLCTGFCSLINGGNYYQPHVVKEIRNADGGTVQTFEKRLMKKTVSKSTSKLIQKYTRQVVIDGTGTGCQIAGYEIAGKTGTAEKLPRNQGKYLLSFIGFAPYDDPQVVVYATVDEINLPSQEQTSYAVHLVQKIMKQLLPYMSVKQKNVSKKDANQKVTNVNENGQTVTNSGDKASQYLNEQDDDASGDAEEIVTKDQSQGNATSTTEAANTDTMGQTEAPTQDTSGQPAVTTEAANTTVVTP